MIVHFIIRSQKHQISRWRWWKSRKASGRPALRSEKRCPPGPLEAGCKHLAWINLLWTRLQEFSKSESQWIMNKIIIEYRKIQKGSIRWKKYSRTTKFAQMLARSPDLRDLYAESGQTLQGSFSAVSKPNFERKYSLESSRRDLHNALLCTAL